VATLSGNYTRVTKAIHITLRFFGEELALMQDFIELPWGGALFAKLIVLQIQKNATKATFISNNLLMLPCWYTGICPVYNPAAIIGRLGIWF